MIRIFFVLLALNIPRLYAQMPYPEMDSATLRKEADTFLAGMPHSLQARQAKAVRRAIQGDTEVLNHIRHSRNAPSPLPEGVSATYLTPRLRLYTPIVQAESARPVLVYFHGGGWTFGSINSCSRFCGELAAKAGISVLAVDYGLAPESPFPHGLNDCINAVRFAMQHAEEWGCASHLVSAGGDSAGGNLAIAVALSMLRSDTIPLRSLVLFYPVTLAYADHSESWKRYGTGFALDSELMEAFNQAYASREASHHPFISVAHAPEELLSQLPPTLFVAAERDILCTQGKEFTRRLNQLGVNINRYEFPAAVHLFITVPGQPLAFNYALSLTASFLCPAPTDGK
ncbi:MAG: alpha/beta hydrolase [Odoribacter sp.]|nr:alpha/beta hydrolase [Odoribacter sp.]